jgi:spore coat protein A
MKASYLTIAAIVIIAVIVAAVIVHRGRGPGPSRIDPMTIPKFQNELVIPPIYAPTIEMDPATKKMSAYYTVDMTEFYEQILPPGYPKTKVWGYGGLVYDPTSPTNVKYVRNSPGPTFEAIQGIPSIVTWVNKITTPNMFAVDPTLHWANPNNMPMMPEMPWPLFPPGFVNAQSPVPLVPHLHGGEQQSYYDGDPDEWFTADGKHGSGYSTYTPTTSNSAVYYYPNEQPPATLWYHDHALGITRLNVMAGLAGFYILNKIEDPIATQLPSSQYDIPLAIQDRSFNSDGSLYFPSEGINPDIHPYWQPEFFGDTIVVNGKVWPNLNVEPRQYLFRLLDGSNARFYTLSLTDNDNQDMVYPFIQIGTDGGYLSAPVTLTSLTIAPGERADILVDFSTMPAGTKIIVRNTAAAPFPEGDPANFDEKTVGQIMQFTVEQGLSVAPETLPKLLNTIPALENNAPTRVLTLYEVDDNNGDPQMVTLNGQRWAGAITETPEVGSTEDWMIVNLTPDAHPIHLHLVQFQLVSRQNFRADDYTADWLALNGISDPVTQLPFPDNVVPETLDVSNYLQGTPIGPALNENGWKDTMQAPPGMVTIIRIRWAPLTAPTSGPNAPTPGVNLYPFDPTAGPGYVWHCHILDHEDDEMMRPYKVVP